MAEHFVLQTIGCSLPT